MGYACTDVLSLGSFVGCGLFEPVCSRWGYKITIYCAAFLQVIAVIGQSLALGLRGGELMPS